MTFAQLLAHGEGELAARGVDTPRVDAEIMLGHVLGLSRTELSLRRASTPAKADRLRFEELLARRSAREPLGYVLGEWGFRRLTLKTDARALVPRPETEIVVERCLQLLSGLPASPRVLDLGTGSGAIALAIADERPDARVTGVDTAPEALALARENAQRLGLDVELRAGGIEAAAEGWELVVSNPPYVAPEEWDDLQPEIREWEPRSALVGRSLHVEIARAARTTWLVLEAGDGQAGTVADALRAHGYGNVRIAVDLTGRERVVEGEQS